jgi:hypothetical protein
MSPLVSLGRCCPPAPSRCKSLQEAGLCKFLLAKDGLFRFRFDQELHSVPESESPSPRRPPGAHIPVPVRRFSHIHVDLVGPLPRSSGFSYLFTVVDRTTRWPEAVPLMSTTAADCAAALLQGWIQRFGVPDIITSDRGPQFTSSLWVSLCTLLSISHTHTTAYHPQPTA